MAVSKVKLNDATLMDVTSDTVVAGVLLNNYTAKKNDGTTVIGNITTKQSSDLEVSGATVTAPAGYYGSDVSASVASGSATTPTTTITSNPTILVNDSGLITASHSSGKSITPTVSAGYISTGTAGTVTASGSSTSQLSVQAAQTIYPKTTDQTIAQGKFLTGAQTFKAVTTSNLTAANIKDGTVVKVGDSVDDDRVAAVTGTFTDASTVSSGQTAAAAGQILSGYSAWVDGTEVKGSISSRAAQTITPTTTNQTIASGVYISGTQTIEGDADLVSGNIKSGVSIFGVSGSSTVKDVSDTTAVAEDVASGKVFYSANGTLTIGSATGGESMVILSYGSSTWQDFIDAYNSNSIVYCRASSNSDPASGSQTRMAFMAYVNNAETPTNVEFQYYRSVATHSDSQQGDQVYVYKLDSTNGWSVTTRNAFSKIVAGTGLSSSYSSGTLTITSPDTVHVGTSAPSDSTIKIWYDTDEPGQTIVTSVNGASGAVVFDADDMSAMHWDLLWENASPTSSFAAQTVSLDLSDYAFVIVGFRWSDSSNQIAWQVCIVGETNKVTRADLGATKVWVARRAVQVSATGVTFADADQGSSTSDPYTTNVELIPVLIYGIRGIIA